MNGPCVFSCVMLILHAYAYVSGQDDRARVAAAVLSGPDAVRPLPERRWGRRRGGGSGSGGCWKCAERDRGGRRGKAQGARVGRGYRGCLYKTKHTFKHVTKTSLHHLPGSAWPGTGRPSPASSATASCTRRKGSRPVLASSLWSARPPHWVSPAGARRRHHHQQQRRRRRGLRGVGEGEGGGRGGDVGC